MVVVDDFKMKNLFLHYKLSQYLLSSCVVSSPHYFHQTDHSHIQSLSYTSHIIAEKLMKRTFNPKSQPHGHLVLCANLCDVSEICVGQWAVFGLYILLSSFYNWFSFVIIINFQNTQATLQISVLIERNINFMSIMLAPWLWPVTPSGKIPVWTMSHYDVTTCICAMMYIQTYFQWRFVWAFWGIMNGLFRCSLNAVWLC